MSTAAREEIEYFAGLSLVLRDRELRVTKRCLVEDLGGRDDSTLVWLVAAGRHESGAPDDFFPYCRGLDKTGRLTPSKDDYKSLFQDQDARFFARILIDAPLLRKRAEQTDGEVSGSIGGRFGVVVVIEVADDLREMTVAFDLRSVGVQTHIPAILAALEADADWEYADRMPSRALTHYEAAFRHLSIDG